MSAQRAAQLFAGKEYRFGFFQAVRLLDLLLVRGPLERVGHGRTPDKEPLRFRSRTALSFPPSELTALGFDLAQPEQYNPRSREPRSISWKLPVEVTVGFMGLVGITGVLPIPYSELVLDRLRRGDRALRDFLDSLTHRFVAFFYRAWAKHRPAIDYEWQANRENPDETAVSGTPLPVALDDFSRHLFSLLGLGSPGLRGRQAFPDAALLRYLPLLTLRQHPARALHSLLADFLGLPDPQVHIAQFVPQEMPLPLHEQSRLGELHSELGVSAVCGDAVVLHDAKFEVVLGALSWDGFAALLPAGFGQRQGERFAAVIQLTRLLVGPELDFAVRLVLQAAAVSTAALGAADSALGAVWVINQAPEQDLSDCLFAGSVGATGCC